MHIHILGICGTFMAGIASIAKEAGHRVTGSDQNVYPPMSDFLNKLDIDVFEGFSKQQLDIYNADVYIIGNVMTRGHEVIESILNQKLAFTSGPEWLYQNVLKTQTVLAISGTHGKTTTSSMLAWLLESNGYQPGFLIGGMPGNFDVSARFGAGKYFVIEADEYDTAFFDKRSKLVHYHPDVVVLNNLEFDHADIFNNINDIKKQFHHMIRCVPNNGTIIFNQDDENILDLLDMGVWSNLTSFGKSQHKANKLDTISNHKKHWQIEFNEDNEQVEISFADNFLKTTELPLGKHNKLNALASMSAANEIGILAHDSIEAFKTYILPKRRLEKITETDKDIVYRDFAHHPTAIFHTISTLKNKHHDHRLVTIIEMRSNSMKSGVHDDKMSYAIKNCDVVSILAANKEQQLRLEAIFSQHSETKHIKAYTNSEHLLNDIIKIMPNANDILDSEQNTKTCYAFLTNGNFDNICEKFTDLVI